MILKTVAIIDHIKWDFITIDWKEKILNFIVTNIPLVLSEFSFIGFDINYNLKRKCLFSCFNWEFLFFLNCVTNKPSKY